MKLSKEVKCIELEGGNAYLIHDDKNILIDTGLPSQQEKLMIDIKNTIGEDSRIDDILLTHHDVDHVGNLNVVKRTFGGTAYIHPLDLPYALGQKKRPGIKHMIEKVIRPERPESIENILKFNDKDIQIIPMPGHTPGHTIIRYKEYLFTGDLFKIENGQIICMKKKMNNDHLKMADSIKKLLTLDAKWICPAHGECVHFDQKRKEELKKVGNEYARN